MNKSWQSRTVEIDGVETHYIEAGQGETVVLVHGGGVSSSAELNYGEAMESLSRNFHVIAPDMPGYGRTPGRAPQDYLPPDQSEFLIKFIRALGRKVHLGGNSAAGYLIQYVGHEAPELVSSLILINSGSGVIVERRDDDGDGYDVRWAVPEKPPTREEVKEGLLAFYQNRDLVTDERVELTYELSHKNFEFATKREATIGHTSADRNRRLQYRGKHISEWADELTMPVLLTWSRENRACMPEQAFPMFNRLTRGEMHVLIDAGHHMQTEHPERWSAVVADFIRSQGA
ncbi:MAG: alpha/beta hydrolase [Thermaerobacterales bacterium]